MCTLAKYRMKPYFPSHDVGKLVGKFDSNGYVYTPGDIDIGLSIFISNKFKAFINKLTLAHTSFIYNLLKD